MRRLRQRATSERDEGWTLIELVTAMAITAVAMALVIPVLVTVTHVTNVSNSSSFASAQGRNAIRQLAADIGSANNNNECFPTLAYPGPPPNASAGPPPTTDQADVIGPCQVSPLKNGSILRVLSNVNNNPFSSTGCTWFQWSVDNSTDATAGWLMQQSWPVGATTAAPAIPLAGPLALDAAGVNPNGSPLFTLDSTGKIISVNLYIKGSTGNSSSAPAYSSDSQAVFLQTSVNLILSTLAAGQC
jgi:type II secretory pathway pseudopilin PulG